MFKKETALNQLYLKKYGANLLKNIVISVNF